MAASEPFPLVVILGPTASGKSALAIDLCQAINGEIICADAWTIRKLADVGTAKPTLYERRLVPHHLIDIIGPEQKFSAAQFKDLASRKIKEISLRGKIAVMVGGSGLYIDSVIYNYTFRSEVNPEFRKKLNQLSLNQLRILAAKSNYKIDKESAKNKRRLIRVIESGDQQDSKQELAKNCLLFGLKIEREDLKKRIKERTEFMFEHGLKSEVTALYNQYGLEAPIFNAVGYKEWIEYFSGAIDEKKVKEIIIRNTLLVAKKQMTWFNKNKSIHWLNTPVNLQGVVEIISTKFGSKIG